MIQARAFCHFDVTATQVVPAGLLRIACRRHDVRLSFNNRWQDHYSISRHGYFIELPEGPPVPVNARTVFPIHERLACLDIRDVGARLSPGSQGDFLCVSEAPSTHDQVMAVDLPDLVADFYQAMPWMEELPALERCVALQVAESGLVPVDELAKAVFLRNSGRTIGQILLKRGDCTWGQMLAACLDTRNPSALDPPEPRAISWGSDRERVGEILIALGKMNRTQLEIALNIRRQGRRRLGEILMGMGACSKSDIEECYRLQKAIRERHASGMGLLGELLVKQGAISEDDLEHALREQKVGRQSLERILLSMGACSHQDIEDFIRVNQWHGVQAEIDGFALGHWLVKVGTITEQQLQEALRIQARGRQFLGELVVTLGLCTEEQVDRALSTQETLPLHATSEEAKLGMLLIRQGKIDFSHLDDALSLQEQARRPLGQILVETGACPLADVEAAVELQQGWRKSHPAPGDHLGDLLVGKRLISPETLACLLPRHVDERRPLGLILVEEGLLSPEQILEVLFDSENKRRQEFARYLHGAAAGRTADTPGNTPVHKLTSWLSRRSQSGGPHLGLSADPG